MLRAVLQARTAHAAKNGARFGGVIIILVQTPKIAQFPA
jgi:hypothetical protein